MKPLEIISALPKWADAAAGVILDSSAFAMPCRVGDETTVLRHAKTLPAESEMLALSVSFGDEPHTLCISRSTRLPELGKLWDNRSDVPEPILLAIVERECGSLLQMLENAVRRQLRLTGLGAVSDAPKLFLELADGSLVFAVTRSVSVVSAFGALRNLDIANDEIRSQMLHSECEYAAFAANDADFASLAPGDAVLLPEIGTVAPRLVVDGRFVLDTNGVALYAEDSLAHVHAAVPRDISLGEVLDAIDAPLSLPVAGLGAPLNLVKGGRVFASGRLDRIADQLAFVVEST